MAAEVPSGEHTFEMKYEPAGLGIGTKIAIVTAVFTVVYVLIGRKLIDRIKIKPKVKEEGEDTQTDQESEVSPADNEVIPDDPV